MHHSNQGLQTYAVNSKLITGDVVAAVRTVTTDYSMIELIPALYRALGMKHPSPPSEVWL